MTEKLEPPIVKDLMVTKIYTVTPDATIDEVITLLIKHDIPAAPVIKDQDGEKKLLGYITEKDCLEYFSNEIYYGNPDVSVQSLMRFPLCASPETDLFSMASIFTEHPHRHLPVAKKKQLVGIISRRSVLHALYEFERKVCINRAKDKCLMDFRELVNLRFIIK
ncbi:MAG: CBS domain-containing protein [Gammaproteobacteria bacterium]|nr:CBS domain-containing protein [Gammaproteobacteria bacterium]